MHYQSYTERCIVELVAIAIPYGKAGTPACAYTALPRGLGDAVETALERKVAKDVPADVELAQDCAPARRLGAPARDAVHGVGRGLLRERKLGDHAAPRGDGPAVVARDVAQRDALDLVLGDDHAPHPVKQHLALHACVSG